MIIGEHTYLKILVGIFETAFIVTYFQCPYHRIFSPHSLLFYLLEQIYQTQIFCISMSGLPNGVMYPPHFKIGDTNYFSLLYTPRITLITGQNKTRKLLSWRWQKKLDHSCLCIRPFMIARTYFRIRVQACAWPIDSSISKLLPGTLVNSQPWNISISQLPQCEERSLQVNGFIRPCAVHNPLALVQIP